MAAPISESIADCVLSTFDDLPRKCKPRALANGRHEWVPLAGIVLSRGRCCVLVSRTTLTQVPRREDHGPASALPHYVCVSLATGMKCLPRSKIASSKGNTLHDWHAEVLAIRTFNRFLLDECEHVIKSGQSEGGGSSWIKWRERGNSHATTQPRAHSAASEWEEQPFALQDDVQIHMYCSEAPCGDASMELTMAGQRDATPWEKPQAVGPDGLLGRGNFDQLGIVRRKPSRPDAPASLSKSCTDKLALKQCTSLLSGLVSLLVHPKNVYLSSLVLPHSQYVEGAVHRAFSAKGRMEPLVRQESLKWTGSGYKFTPFTVRTTSKEFTFSKRAGSGEHGTVSSNLSAVYTPRRQEVLINGMLQGRKAVDPRGASCVSRRVMWASVLELAVRLGIPALVAALKKATYAEVKAAERLGGRELVKSLARDEALQGWRRNDGDDDWSL